MSYLDTYLSGRKRITEFKNKTDEELDARINEILARQRKAEEERRTKEQKAKDDYENMLAEKRLEALQKHKEWLEYLKTVHGCGCNIREGEKRQPDICWDCDAD